MIEAGVRAVAAPYPPLRSIGQFGPNRVEVDVAGGAEELPVVGVFSLGSPTRPNPVGLSLVRLVRIEEGRNLVVRDLEYFDGTPVVDIKPYLSAYRTDEFQVPGWYADLASKAGVPP